VAVTTKRLAAALSVAGVATLALAVGLGGRVGQEHLMARRAWLSTSADPAAEDYDARRSDELYDASVSALESLETWAVVGGAGLLALVLGLAMRRSPRGPARRPWLRGVAALVVGLTVHAALVVLGARFDHPLLGTLVGTVGSAVAPFVAIASAALVWITRRGARSRMAGSAAAPPPGRRS